MSTVNERLRQAIRTAGCTYAELAREVRSVAAENGDTRLRTNSSAVTHWVAGTRPGGVTAGYLSEALSRRLGHPVTPEQLGLTRESARPTEDAEPTAGAVRAGSDPVDDLTRLGRADIERRRSATSAAYSVAAAALPLGSAEEFAGRAATCRVSGAAGEGEIQAVLEMTELFTAVDERHGGQHGRTAVVQYLISDVAALCRARFRTEEQRGRMLSAAACLAYLAGWKAYDAGEQGLAQQYYLHSYRLTREAGNDRHGAFILRVLAHHSLEVGRTEHTLDLIEAALERVKGHCDPATESLYVVTRARALAAVGRRREAVAEAARAARLGSGADEAEMPYWAAMWGPAAACVDAHTAKTARTLGEFAAAERHFAQSVSSPAAVARRGGAYDEQRRRIASLSIAQAGAMQCRQGHVEQACATWGRALELMEGLRSARVTQAVARMRTDLEPLECRGARVALEFGERVRTWQEARF